ncbi:MAG: ABC transporter permease [Chloroflexota bacterium]
MSLRRVAILLTKELTQGPRSFIFIMAIVLPVVTSLALSLAFGTLFAEKPQLGIVDEGSSTFVAMARQLTNVDTAEFDTDAALKEAVERGAVDMGIVLPPDFASAVRQGAKTEIKAYVWGESLAKDRTILGVTAVSLVRELAGQEVPVEVSTVTLGDEAPIPWSARVFPLIVLMVIFMAGLFVPATSVVLEKEKGTLVALVVTPTSVGELFAAKGLLGVILSIFAGIAILVMNQAFGAQPALLVLILTLGAIMAAELGLLLGALLKDWTTLFTVWKSGAILLFAPGFIYLFPQIPEWVAKVFPTYYLIQPIIQLSQQGAGWEGIVANVFLLVGLDIVLVGVLVVVLGRVKQYAV